MLIRKWLNKRILSCQRNSYASIYSSKFGKYGQRGEIVRGHVLYLEIAFSELVREFALENQEAEPLFNVPFIENTLCHESRSLENGERRNTVHGAKGIDVLTKHRLLPVPNNMPVVPNSPATFEVVKPEVNSPRPSNTIPMSPAQRAPISLMKRTLSSENATAQVILKEPTNDRVDVEVSPCFKRAACMTPQELPMPFNQKVKIADENTTTHACRPPSGI